MSLFEIGICDRGESRFELLAESVTAVSEITPSANETTGKTTNSSAESQRSEMVNSIVAGLVAMAIG